MPSLSTRVRGWVLLKVDNPRDAVKILCEFFTQGGERYVVVRADIVSPLEAKTCDYNIVVPVDAVDNNEFQGVMKTLVEAVGATHANALMVTEHYPKTVHAAHSFITVQEFSDLPLREYDPPGRHPKSPGANPWG